MMIDILSEERQFELPRDLGKARPILARYLHSLTTHIAWNKVPDWAKVYWLKEADKLLELLERIGSTATGEEVM